jgi:hypothetical protein
LINKRVRADSNAERRHKQAESAQRLEGAEWRKLLNSIQATTLRDLRDRAVRSLTYSVAWLDQLGARSKPPSSEIT